MFGLREEFINGTLLLAMSKLESNVVPFGKAANMFRSCNKGFVDEKSTHRGIITEQTQAVYAALQSLQFFAREYAPSGSISQGIWASVY
jgi:hypothetical protein